MGRNLLLNSERRTILTIGKQYKSRQPIAFLTAELMPTNWPMFCRRRTILSGKVARKLKVESVVVWSQVGTMFAHVIYAPIPLSAFCVQRDYCWKHIQHDWQSSFRWSVLFALTYVALCYALF